MTMLWNNTPPEQMGHTVLSWHRTKVAITLVPGCLQFLKGHMHSTRIPFKGPSIRQRQIMKQSSYKKNLKTLFIIQVISYLSSALVYSRDKSYCLQLVSLGLYIWMFGCNNYSVRGSSTRLHRGSSDAAAPQCTVRTWYQLTHTTLGHRIVAPSQISNIE